MPEELLERISRCPSRPRRPGFLRSLLRASTPSSTSTTSAPRAPTCASQIAAMELALGQAVRLRVPAQGHRLRRRRNGRTAPALGG